MDPSGFTSHKPRNKTEHRKICPLRLWSLWWDKVGWYLQEPWRLSELVFRRVTSDLTELIKRMCCEHFSSLRFSKNKRGFHWRRSQRGIQSWPLGWGVWVKGRSKTFGFRTSTICDAFLIHTSGSHCCCDGCISPRSSWFCDHRRCPWCQQFHGCTCPKMYKLRMSEKKNFKARRSYHLVILRNDH